MIEVNDKKFVFGKIVACFLVGLIVGALLVGAVSVSADEGTPLFEDDFSELNLNNWIISGSPSPRVLASVEGRTGVFDNNGDGWCDSNAVSKDTFSFPKGFTMESDVYVSVTNMAGCWDTAAIAVTRNDATPYEPSDCPGEYYYNFGVRFRLYYAGDACWCTPSELRRHAYFDLGLYTEDESGEGENYINADDYINGWHNLKIVVGEDRFVSFYCDDDLIYTSEKRIHEDALQNEKIYLGERSSGSAGKVYHDYIKVYGGEEELPDLTVSSKDITFSNPTPAAGETVTITATIHNIGNADANDVVVQFFDGDPDNGGTQIEDDQTIDSTGGNGGTETAQVEWTAISGSHDIYVIVDPYDDISESDENNNEAFKEIKNAPSYPPREDIIFLKKPFIIGDPDNDGENEIIKWDGKELKIIKYDLDSEEWTEEAKYQLDKTISTVAIKNLYNNDGDNEVIIGTQSVTGSIIILKYGNGVFMEIERIDISQYILRTVKIIEIKDLNADGQNEIVVLQSWVSDEMFTVDSLTVCKKTDNGWKTEDLFSQFDMPLVDTRFTDVDIGDVNHDGRPEIVLGMGKLVYTPDIPSFSASGYIYLFYYKAGEWKKEKINPIFGDATFIGKYPTSITIGDGKGDDITRIYAGLDTGEAIEYEYNNGHWIEAKLEGSTARGPISSVIADDSNNNGLKDVLIVSNNFYSMIKTIQSRAIIFEYDVGWEEIKVVAEDEQSFYSAEVGDAKNWGINSILILRGLTLLTCTATCPVDLEIKGPAGLIIGKQLNEFSMATYEEIDINGDGDPDDIITIPNRKVGIYQITVIPEPDAKPTDTYTLKVSAGDTTIVLAENVPISDIPNQPYIIRSAEEGIIQIIPATVRIEPETLNLARKGVFTAFIQLPEGYNVSDINISSVECKCASAIKGVIVHGGEGGHHGKGYIGDTLKVKFNRQDLREDLPTGDEVEMIVTGRLFDGTPFEGNDVIRVIDQG